MTRLFALSKFASFDAYKRYCVAESESLRVGGVVLYASVESSGAVKTTLFTNEVFPVSVISVLERSCYVATILLAMTLILSAIVPISSESFETSACWFVTEVSRFVTLAFSVSHVVV
ncbi:hypothetical protein [Sulfurimonas sp.]|uniref:hypothetical protein n=1 Tax=Sulfurimonas sp. TaxID=2022749 RepID=UPI0026180A95|nr:hypothetical protein [Sulfurimonas sp.]